MTEFNEEDIKPLDFIISQLSFKSAVTTDDLVKEGLIAEHKNIGFEIDVAYNPVKEFVRYLHILNEYAACECYFSEDSEFARTNQKTLHIQKQGGFAKIFLDSIEMSKTEKQKSDLEIKNLKLQTENLEYQKSIRTKEDQIRNLTKDNLRLGNWDIRFRWYIVIVTFIVGFFVKYFIDN